MRQRVAAAEGWEEIPSLSSAQSFSCPPAAVPAPLCLCRWTVSRYPGALICKAVNSSFIPTSSLWVPEKVVFILTKARVSPWSSSLQFFILQWEMSLTSTQECSCYQFNVFSPWKKVKWRAKWNLKASRWAGTYLSKGCELDVLHCWAWSVISLVSQAALQRVCPFPERS